MTADEQKRDCISEFSRDSALIKLLSKQILLEHNYVSKANVISESENGAFNEADNTSSSNLVRHDLTKDNPYRDMVSTNVQNGHLLPNSDTSSVIQENKNTSTRQSSVWSVQDKNTLNKPLMTPRAGLHHNGIFVLPSACYADPSANTANSEAINSNGQSFQQYWYLPSVNQAPCVTVAEYPSYFNSTVAVGPAVQSTLIAVPSACLTQPQLSYLVNSAGNVVQYLCLPNTQLFGHAVCPQINYLVPANIFCQSSEVIQGSLDEKSSHQALWSENKLRQKPGQFSQGNSPNQYLPVGLHEQNLLAFNNTNLKLKVKRNNMKSALKKHKYCRKQLADIQNINTQTQPDELLDGVAGLKKPRRQGGQPRSAALKLRKNSSLPSGSILSDAARQQPKSKCTSKGNEANKSRKETDYKEEEPQKPITAFFSVRRSDRKRLTSRELKKVREKELQEKVKACCEDGLKVVDIDGKGRGVIATKEFEKDDFVVEYAGELVNITTAKQREQLYERDEQVGCYMYYFNHKNKQYCVDATKETGKLGRLVNHSRRGNCHTKVIDVGTRPYLVLIASHHIAEGEELTYDYGDRSQSALESHPWLRL